MLVCDKSLHYRFLFCALFCVCILFTTEKNYIMKALKTDYSTLSFTHLLQLKIGNFKANCVNELI